MPRAELVNEHDLKAAINYLKGVLDREPTNKEIARYLSEKFHLTIRWHYVNKQKVKYGLTREHLDHSDLIPETLLPEDLKSTEAQYLRILGALAKREMRPMVAVNKAANWAEKHTHPKVKEDVRYDPEKPPGERWVYFKADPKNWRLKRALDAAKEGLSELMAKAKPEQ